MLINAKELLNEAMNGKYAIPQFNINNLEWTKYILETCEEFKSPVILGVSEGGIKHIGGYKIVFNMVSGLIEDLKITIPVVLHLDHGNNIDNCKKAMDNGFTSVMIDASNYDINKNIDITKEVVNYAHQKNVSVEAEVGYIGKADNGIIDESSYAEVEDCVRLVKGTNIDSLAPALGNVHGLYKGEPKLDFDKMLEIKEKTNKPLVLHGGTGIPNDVLKKAIENGITKVNINTELQIVWTQAVRKYLDENKEVYNPRKIISAGEKAIKEVVKEKIMLFGSNNKA